MEFKFYEKFNSLTNYQKDIINNYLKNIRTKCVLEKFQDAYLLSNVLPLINYTEIINETEKTLLKLDLFNQLTIENEKKNISNIKAIYINKSINFGNTMIILNNLLYYSEILNIKEIYLNSEMNWPIKKNVSLDKAKISIISPSEIDIKDKNIVSLNPFKIYFQKVFRPEIRINKLKSEILKNLPKIFIFSEDLYIHIRSGDIFRYKSGLSINYAEPPLCFYQKVLYNYKFRNIYIISEDQRNPNILPLTSQFPNIILTKNNINTDIAILSNAYNIIGSMSSFLTSLIFINTKLKNYWEYDNYRLAEKYLHLHPDIYREFIRYNLYKMFPSKKYRNEMFPWKNTKRQIDLMLKEKCKDFIKVHHYNNILI